MGKESTTPANIWQKLNLARQDFYNAKVQQSGLNLHAEFKYFELKDIVPIANEIFTKYGCMFNTDFRDGKAVGKFIDMSDPDDVIEVGFDMRSIAEPAKFRMNEVQALGAEITYMRRYLYFIILDITVNDELDSGENDIPTAAPSRPTTPAQRQEVKKELTAVEDNATDLQITALKNVLKRLRESDPSKEEYIAELAIETKGFTTIRKDVCEQLINQISDMVGE